jgi:hypothetical protein
MEQDISLMLSEEAPSDMELIRREIVGAVIGIIGYTLLVISAKQDAAEVTRSQNETDPPEDPSPAPKTAAISSILIMLANVILAGIAVERLKKLSREPESINGTLEPNYRITAGSVLSASGNIIEAIGTLQRASEPGVRITIL